MGETANNSNQNTGILITRNTPVALVVGCAGFLGSHLTEKLLDKDLQVIGVDNFSTGKREYLSESIKSKNFHLIFTSVEELKLDLPRLDYLFIVAGPGWNSDNLLKIFQEFSPKVVFVSSIELYEREHGDDLHWYKDNEGKLAKFAQEHHLNARVVRLAAVYGPRMSFDSIDPIVKLIHSSLLGNLQRETATLEFSTRALYISDAVDLIVKSMLAGSTAMRIFDGSLSTPIKVSEIKQILLDPVWYENRGFDPSELPPWPTPNLEKTVSHLSWHPKVGIVKALKETISFFKDNEIPVPTLEKEKFPPKFPFFEASDKEGEGEPKDESKTDDKSEQSDKTEGKKVKTRSRWGSEIRSKTALAKSQAYLVAALLIIAVGLVWPLTQLAWGVLTFKYQLAEAQTNLSRGEFNKSLANLELAQQGVDEINSFIGSMVVLRQSGLVNPLFESADNMVKLATLSNDGAKQAVLGMQDLYGSLKAITGEAAESPKDGLGKARVELAAADDSFSQVSALSQNPNFQKSVPGVLRSRVSELTDKLKSYSKMTDQARSVVTLLPEVVALDGKKSYLVLLQNNMELRPTGGFIGSFASIQFEGGKLKKLDVNDVYNIDGQLKIHVEPPKEIKDDLGQKDWYLRDSNWEPDFPTSARQAEWFYNQETGELVQGVVALDISAIDNLLNVIGPLDLADYNQKITADNLFEQSITHAEQGFFPGSQAKKSFLSALTNQLFNKIFFLPNQNWPGIVQSINRSVEENHLSMYLNNPALFSYLASQGWTGSMVRPIDDKVGESNDFLAPVEANLGANKANYYIDRKYTLETTIGKEGEVQQRFKVNYINRSPSDTWPAGKYKNRMRIYLPFGTKLNQALWGETEITSQVSTFIDYGRTGFSLLLELDPKASKTLVVDYQLPNKLSFADNKTTYKLDVVKQSGTGKDPFEWTISYPISYHVVSGNSNNLSPQEQTVDSDLSKNRHFEIQFSK